MRTGITYVSTYVYMFQQKIELICDLCGNIWCIASQYTHTTQRGLKMNPKLGAPTLYWGANRIADANEVAEGDVFKTNTANTKASRFYDVDTMLSCHAGRQEVSRCRTRGDSGGSIACT